MLFGIDAASYQGAVVWSEVARSCAFGFEKVTQGTGYANPYWSTASTQLSALARTGSFVPGAYMFLEQGNAAAQVDFFVSKLSAINTDEWLIAIDAEPSTGSNPIQADLNEATTRMRELLPEHTIIGYCPEWYWGSQPLVQFDSLWASHYASKSGTPEEIYTVVPTTWWADYGGRSISLLQFSESATVSGISGTVDTSAFRGTLAQLKELTKISVPITPTPVPVTVPPIALGADTMYVFDQPKNKQVVIPVTDTQKLSFFAAQEPGAISAQLQIVCGPGEERVNVTPTWNHPSVVTLPKGTSAVAISREDDGDVTVTVTIS